MMALDQVDLTQGSSLPRLQRRIRWPAITAFVFAVAGYLPGTFYLWLICRPVAVKIMRVIHPGQFTGWQTPLRLLSFWFVFPLTTLSIPFAIMGLWRIRKSGQRFLAEGGSQGLIMWMWLACDFALLLAVIRAVELLAVGGWATFLPLY